MLVQVRSGFSMGGTKAIGTIGFHNSSLNAASSVSMPGGVASGDLAVLFDFAMQSGAIPTDVSPSGFTRIGSSQTSINGGIGVRFNMFSKVLTGGESTVTGMSDGIILTKNLLVFRVTGGGTWSAAGSIGQAVGAFGGTMASPQTVTVGAAPLVVVAAVFSNASGDIDMSPAAEAEQNLDSGAGGWLSSGYKIHNAAPSNNNVTSLDTASMIAIGACYFSLT